MMKGEVTGGQNVHIVLNVTVLIVSENKCYLNVNSYIENVTGSYRNCLTFSGCV